MDDRTPKQRIADILNRNGIDLDLYDLGTVIEQVAEVLADDTEKREPHATYTITALREGASQISRNLGYLEDGE